MAGHSKWANIQHRKKRQDAKRGKLFTKLIREITVASRAGGQDQSANSRLRLAIDKALSSNMPKDTIDRAIKRGAGDQEGANFEEIRYEGYGPSGVAVLVDCMTDNKNRSVAEIRHCFVKHGGNLGSSGCVAYLFHQTGILSYAKNSDEEKILDIATNSGAEDVNILDDGSIEVLVEPKDFMQLKEALLLAKLTPDIDEVTYRAETVINLSKNDAISLLQLLDELEELDDVQNVYSNAEVDDDILDGIDN
jgi:YebC/PmpR family DNA-binding regulatory protein